MAPLPWCGAISEIVFFVSAIIWRHIQKMAPYSTAIKYRQSRYGATSNRHISDLAPKNQNMAIDYRHGGSTASILFWRRWLAPKTLFGAKISKFGAKNRSLRVVTLLPNFSPFWRRNGAIVAAFAIFWRHFIAT